MTKRYQLLVCDGPSCGVCLGSERLKNAAQERIAGDPTLAARLFVFDLTCFGRCDDGPNMMVREVPPSDDPEIEPDSDELQGVRGLYTGVDETRLARIIDEHVLADAPLDDVETWD